jgi:molybdopterin-guanine dinucleotide biosynthesis protein A
MGADKRMMLIEGVPLLSRAVAAVSRIATEVLVATTHARPLPVQLPDVRIVYDRVNHGGPLAGIDVALAEARHELVLIVAGDMPWLQESLLRLLVDRARSERGADAVAIQSPRGSEPLLAVYRPSVRPVLTGLVDRGERRVGRLHELIHAVGISEDEWRRVDPEGRSLVNINRPADIG